VGVYIFLVMSYSSSLHRSLRRTLVRSVIYSAIRL